MLLSKSDCVIKTYNSGKLKGIVCLFLVSSNARKTMMGKTDLIIDEEGNILIAVSESKKEKLVNFISNNSLTYEEVIIN